MVDTFFMYQYLSIPIGIQLFLVLLWLNKLSNFHENLQLILLIYLFRFLKPPVKNIDN